MSLKWSKPAEASGACSEVDEKSRYGVIEVMKSPAHRAGRCTVLTAHSVLNGSVLGISQETRTPCPCNGGQASEMPVDLFRTSASPPQYLFLSHTSTTATASFEFFSMP